MDPAVAPLTRWENFYVIVGSSAAALTGLQFVVIALVSDMEQRRTTGEIDAFASPTIVHFCVSLLIAATLSAPWDSLTPPAVLFGILGLAGLVYAAIIIRRTKKQTGYTPVFEDWLWHAALPIVVYAALAGAALVIRRYERNALFVIAGVTLMLVFIGIHNAWDSVTYITITRLERRAKAKEAAGLPPDAPAPDESKPAANNAAV
jgi:hypothetical protein